MKKQLLVSNLEVDMYGTKSWWINGKLHRDENDLPAIERSDGTKSWYQNGKCHRDNGLPAVEYFDGHKVWYKNGVKHRDNNLPAVEYDDGDKAWYNENGDCCRWDDWIDKL